jgi:hypothetical protein
MPFQLILTYILCCCSFYILSDAFQSPNDVRIITTKFFQICIYISVFDLIFFVTSIPFSPLRLNLSTPNVRATHLLTDSLSLPPNVLQPPDNGQQRISIL